MTSEQGPVCPTCERQYTPNDQMDYDPTGYTIDCDGCGQRYNVEARTVWTTSDPEAA